MATKAPGRELLLDEAAHRPWRITRWPMVVLIAGALVTLSWRLDIHRAANPVIYQTASVLQANLSGRVTATGTLSALVTVQVGTQISGRIRSIAADFNTLVKKGQVIAKIDPQFYDAALQQSRASLLVARANLESTEATATNAEKQRARTKALHDRDLNRFTLPWNHRKRATCGAMRRGVERNVSKVLVRPASRCSTVA
jgi:multidrug efflux pump subunit AcrA (membrane-fusion protein)